MKKAETTIFSQIASARCLSLQGQKRKISPKRVFDGRCHSETFYSEQCHSHNKVKGKIKTNEEEGGDKSEEGGDKNQEEGHDESEVEGEDEREKEADNSWNGTGEEETEKGLESCRKRTNELRKMAEDLDRDFEKVREKARQDRKEKENIYNAYQELLKGKEKDDGETEAKIRRLEEMNEEKDKKIEEKDEKLSADFFSIMCFNPF